MFAKTDVILGLVIFLTIGATLLVVVVVCVALYARKLRKEIEAEFIGDTKLVQKVTVRKRNKYTTSEHNKNEHELSFYESPPLTDAQRERLKENQTANQTEDGRKDIFPAKTKTKVSAYDPYIEVINDGVTPDYVTYSKESRHDDTEDLYVENFDDLAPDYVTTRKELRQEDNDDLYTEAIDGEHNDATFKALSGNPVASRPSHVMQHQELPMRRQPNNPSQRHVTQRRDPVTQPGSLINLHVTSWRPPKGSTTSKSLDNRKPRPSPKPLKTFESRVTQQIASHNASNTSPKSHVDGRANKGFAEPDSDQLYGNQVRIDEMSRMRALENTEIPNPSSDEIYGNQVIIDDQRNTNQVTGDAGYLYNDANDEQIYGNQEIIEDNQQEIIEDNQQEIYENCIEGESLYENYDTSPHNNNSSC